MGYDAIGSDIDCFEFGMSVLSGINYFAIFCVWTVIKTPHPMCSGLMVVRFIQKGSEKRQW